MGFRLRAPRLNARRIFTPPAAVKSFVKAASAPVRVGATVGLTGGGSLLFSKYGQGLLGRATSLAQSIFAKPEGAGENIAENYSSGIYPTDLLRRESPIGKLLPWALGGVGLLAALWFFLRRRR